VLVHPNRKRSVPLAIGDHRAQAEMDRIAGLLNLAEISSRELYKLTYVWDAFGPAEPQSRLGEVRG
jgi:hypothetical protein